MRRAPSWFNITSLMLGLAFLYLPMVVLVIYSFNASRLVTVWGGFSTKWYAALFHDDQFITAAMISLRVALAAATLSVVLGTMAAYVLVRAGKFLGRTVFQGMIFAPLVMPEVITALSMLLLFIATGVNRGQATLVVAQTTLLMCFVCVVVSARLASHDRAMEEAALDLGCTPFAAFRLVTLPIIAPAVISAWLLAFSMSLDDLVMAAFIAGPDATTLPVRVFSAVRTGVSPQINALSTLIIGIVTLGVIVSSLINRHAAVRASRLARQDET